ncbi:MAG: hypothetical protein NVSMB58_37100 [Terriglobales bacterium]
MDPRERFITRVARGKDFIDVGGLSNVIYERISSAYYAGAKKLCMLDIEGPDCSWWSDLRMRLRDRQINDCDFISCNFLTSDLPKYDIVHSSGILYHLPSPLLYIKRLHEITREYCILTSVTINDVLRHGAKELRVPDGSVIFLPALAGDELDIVSGWFRAAGYGEVAERELARGGYSNLENYYPNWFMPTVNAFKAMAVCGGFEIVDEAPIEANNYAYCLLLRPQRVPQE